MNEIPKDEFERMWNNRHEEALVHCVFKGHRVIAVGSTIFIESLEEEAWPIFTEQS